MVNEKRCVPAEKINVILGIPTGLLLDFTPAAILCTTDIKTQFTDR